MILGITGKKGSGKDTFARPLIEDGWHHFKFADPLKAMLDVMLWYSGVEYLERHQLINGSRKEEPLDVLGGQTTRHAMQTLGTEWRDTICENLWTNIWLNRVKEALADGNFNIVCTDVRFPHEVEAVRSLGGKIIRIVNGFSPSDSSDTHASETLMDNIVPDFTYKNKLVCETLNVSKEIAANTEVGDYGILDRVLGNT